MLEKMDRSEIIITTQEESDKMDDLYWANATVKERLQTVTYLREYFYGKEATTGRLQRFYTTVEYK
jgi:hypothetical protein